MNPCPVRSDPNLSVALLVLDTPDNRVETVLALVSGILLALTTLKRGEVRWLVSGPAEKGD